MSSTRIADTFKRCASEGRKAFVAYVAAGDPTFEESLKVIESLRNANVDILELGVPFSDPLADGVANQLAADRALRSGMTTQKVLELAKEIRKQDSTTPIVLFTYLNPIVYGSDFSQYCKDAVDAGIDAMLILDMPPEESGIYREAIDAAGLQTVSLVAPTTLEERLPILTDAASGFIYYVSREGVTGEGDSFSADFSTKIDAIKKHTDLPVVVGFGISTPEHVKAAASAHVDGVVVGSAIVRQVEAYSEGKSSLTDIETFVRSLTSALTC